MPRRCSAWTTRVGRDDLFTDQAYIGDGYGIPTAGGLEAIKLLADTEAILLDPTYTSKAMAALIRHVREGELVIERDRGVPAHRRLPCAVHADAVRAC